MNKSLSTVPLEYTNHRGMGTDTSLGGMGPNRSQNCFAPSATEKMNFRGSAPWNWLDHIFGESISLKTFDT